MVETTPGLLCYLVAPDRWRRSQAWGWRYALTLVWQGPPARNPYACSG